ncbi:MAG TPA: hypothetical protein PKD23_00225 [Bellilinea sp.]|nr:hypothetical protein [Bellilinea sp.]
MDHVVYLDAKAKELAKILSGEKKMIIRGAAGRKMPYDRVHTGDRLYFTVNDGNGKIQAAADVIDVYQSAKMSVTESQELVAQNQDKLCLSAAQTERWAGKKFLVLVTIGAAVSLPPFAIDRSAFGNMDDWLLVEDIQPLILKD